MSLRINHNTSAINSHRNLLKNDADLSKSLEKLSSGLKVNRASDGPATLVISEQMRAQISGMNQAILNSEAAVSMIQTAEGALNEVNTLLVSMRQLALHAANEGANDDVMLAADQQEIINSLSTIERISRNTSFGTKKLLDGSNGANGKATGVGLQFVGASTMTKSSQEGGFDVKIFQNATRANIEGTVALTQEIVSAGETFTIIQGGKSASYTTTDLDTVDTAVANLANAIEQVGLNVNVELSEAGTIKVRHNEYGSDPAFQVSSSTAGILSQEAGEIEVANAGQDITGTINGESAIGVGQILTGVTGAQNADGLSVRYIGDAGREGSDPIGEEGLSVGKVNVSQNSLMFQVGANRNQTVSISLLNTSGRELSRGIENESGFGNLMEVDVMSTQGSQDSLLLIDNAINEISRTRADLGAFQKNTLESNLSNLRIASENLVAAESSIRDTDMANEMATFTRNKIMMDSATAMLSHANQVPKTVLTLLG